MSARDERTYGEALPHLGGLGRTFRLLLDADGDGPLALMAKNRAFPFVRLALTGAMRHRDRHPSRQLGDFLTECAAGIVERFGEHLSQREVPEVFRLGAAGLLPGGADGHRRAMGQLDPNKVYALFAAYLDEVRPFLEVEKRQAERRLLERAKAGRDAGRGPTFDELCAMRIEDLRERSGALGLADVSVADFWALQHLGHVNGHSLPPRRRETIRAMAAEIEEARALEALAGGAAILGHYLRTGRTPDDFEMATRATAAKIATLEIVAAMEGPKPLKFARQTFVGEKTPHGGGNGAND